MVYVVLAVSVGMMAFISIWAYRNVAPDMARLPMQWSQNGTVNWRAPRLVAICASPLLMLGLMGAIFYFSRNDHAERDMALLWVGFLAPPLQALHLALVARTVENEE